MTAGVLGTNNQVNLGNLGTLGSTNLGTNQGATNLPDLATILASLDNMRRRGWALDDEMMN